MAKKAMKLKQAKTPKFSTRAYTRCRICGRPHSVLKSMASAGFASGNLRTGERFPVSRRHPGDF